MAKYFKFTKGKMLSENAEKLNGRLAMLGVIAALGAYALTGQFIPGVW